MTNTPTAPMLGDSGEELLEPGLICRDGSFLWQMDSPSGAGMNLWSGKLSANNGYSEEHAVKAAALFVAAPALLEACKQAESWLSGWASAEPYLTVIRAAIASATTPLSK